jgi:hypothetical protein
MSVSCVRCVLSGRGHCDGLITRPKESYRVWSIMRRPWPTSDCCTIIKKYISLYSLTVHIKRFERSESEL